MPTRYVGAGGNNANTGLSWAQRKLTLNGVEDTPVVAGDTVYVGPGVYRETLTCDVSGAAGSAITYIGDYTGANTDGVGGVVRITGSDNDQTAARANCIVGGVRSYRTFTGFQMDGCSAVLISVAGATSNWTITECYGIGTSVGGTSCISFDSTLSAVVIQDCVLMAGATNPSTLIRLGTGAQASTGNYVQNCILLGGQYPLLLYSSGTTVRNSAIMFASGGGIAIYADVPAGQSVTVNNNVFYGCTTVLQAVALGELVEDYNCIYASVTPRTNVAVGANSNTFITLWDTRWFFQLVTAAAAQQVITPFDLGQWSQLINVAGTAPTATDMRGTGTVGAQREWGALEYDTSLGIEGGGGGGAVSISPHRGDL